MTSSASTVSSILLSLDGAGGATDVDDLVGAAAGSRARLIDAQAPLLARLHLRSDDFVATHGLQQLHRALARLDRDPPMLPLQSRREKRRNPRRRSFDGGSTSSAGL